MLPGVKPILFNTQEEAMPTALQLEIDVISRVNINEIPIYPNIFEIRVPVGDSESFRASMVSGDIIHEKVETKYVYFVTKKPYHEQSKVIEGLYVIDKKEDQWIYGKFDQPIVTFNPDKNANLCFYKLEEAKAKMTMSSGDKTEIQKLEGVLLFVKRIIKNQMPYEDEFDVQKPPEDLIDEAYNLLEEAKNQMVRYGYEKKEIAKYESVALFINKIRKQKGISI